LANTQGERHLGNAVCSKQESQSNSFGLTDETRSKSKQESKEQLLPCKRISKSFTCACNVRVLRKMTGRKW
jgi:hypothetical protein